MVRQVLLLTLTAWALVAASGCQEASTSKSVQSEQKAPSGAEIRSAGGGEVAALVRSELALADKEGRRLVIYVGASWCEPCEYFQDAVKAGQLPEEFADLRFLKFDNDVDDERLSAAGFGGQMIPRFVVPKSDGTGSESRFEGSIKGPGAIDNIVPKLRKLMF